MSTAKFIGLDVHNETIAVAVADDGRSGEIRFHGTIPNTPDAIRRLVSHLLRSGELTAIWVHGRGWALSLH